MADFSIWDLLSRRGRHRLLDGPALCQSPGTSAWKGPVNSVTAQRSVTVDPQETSL